VAVVEETVLPLSVVGPLVELSVSVVSVSEGVRMSVVGVVGLGSGVPDDTEVSGESCIGDSDGTVSDQDELYETVVLVNGVSDGLVCVDRETLLPVSDGV